MTIPRINPNDPKWTAYVLGELDEADTQAVERLLESSAEARALVAEIEAATMAIDESLALEPSPLLLPAQRAAVRRAAALCLRRNFPLRYSLPRGEASTGRCSK